MSNPLERFIKYFSRYSIIGVSRWFVGSSRISKSHSSSNTIARAKRFF